MFSMLQSLWRPASIWNDSSCFLDSVEQLSHTESLYSSKGRTYEIHIFSKNNLLTLLRVCMRLSLVHVLAQVLFIRFVQQQFLERIRPN